MAWRRTGDKPLSEPMLAYFAGVNSLTSRINVWRVAVRIHTLIIDPWFLHIVQDLLYFVVVLSYLHIHISFMIIKFALGNHTNAIDKDITLTHRFVHQSRTNSTCTRTYVYTTYTSIDKMKLVTICNCSRLKNLQHEHNIYYWNITEQKVLFLNITVYLMKSAHGFTLFSCPDIINFSEFM